MDEDVHRPGAPRLSVHLFIWLFRLGRGRRPQELRGPAARAELLFAPLMWELVVGTEGEHCSANHWEMLTVAVCNAMKHSDTMFPFVPIEVPMAACGKKFCARRKPSMFSLTIGGAFVANLFLLFGWGVAVGHRNSEGLRRAQNFHSLRSCGNWLWEQGGTLFGKTLGNVDLCCL